MLHNCRNCQMWGSVWIFLHTNIVLVALFGRVGTASPWFLLIIRRSCFASQRSCFLKLGSRSRGATFPRPNRCCRVPNIRTEACFLFLPRCGLVTDASSNRYTNWTIPVSIGFRRRFDSCSIKCHGAEAPRQYTVKTLHALKCQAITTQRSESQLSQRVNIGGSLESAA